ncbi:MAG: HEAT repeat domain-containing protein, partial [Planctomycetota bacterium]
MMRKGPRFIRVLCAAALLYPLIPGGPVWGGEAEIKPLLEKLKDRDPGVRARAIDALGEAKAKAAVPKLVTALAQDPDTLVRRAAARALGKIRDRKALTALLFAITHQEDSGVIAAAVEAARAIDRRRASRHIVSVLKAPKSSHAERLNAVHALCLIPESASLGALIQSSLRDDFTMVRKAALKGIKSAPDRRHVLQVYFKALAGSNKKMKQRAAFALGEIGDPEARPLLIHSGLGPNSRIEFEALQALAKIPHADSIPALMAVWQRNLKDEQIRLAVVHALAEIKSLKTFPVLKKAIEGKDWFLRVLGAMGLGALGSDAEIFSYLMEGLKRSAKGKRLYDYVVALGLVGNPEAVLGLAVAAKMGNEKVALAAVDSLSRIEGETAKKALVEMMNDQRPDVRGLAARRLGILSHQGAFEKLLDLIGDGAFSVRMDAAQAIGRLKNEKGVAALIVLGTKTESSALRAVVAQALGEINSALGDTPAFHESLKYLSTLLTDEDILVRAAAAWALEGAVCGQSVEAILNAWKSEKNPYVAHTFFQALRSLTRKELMEDPVVWEKWWGTAKAKFGRKERSQEISIPAFQVYLKELRARGLDLVFVLDVTGSMGAELLEAQKRSGDIVRILRMIIPSLRVGFVAFRDEVKKDEKHPLTFDYEAVFKDLNKLEAVGGGDINEAICLGFESALR